MTSREFFIVCPDCKGKTRAELAREQKPMTVMLDRCPTCNGPGKLLTEEGHKIAMIVEHVQQGGW
jgi:hypothetical protein